jgi:hypothetical protein
MTIEKLVTEKGNSYWNETGAYQKEYSELWDKLVPSSGEAPTIHGELIRCGSRLQYDYCNNGNCNAVETETEYETEYNTCNCCQGSGVEINYDEDDEEVEVDCSECGGSGETEEEVEIDGDKVVTRYYKDMLEFLDAYLTDPMVVERLEAFMTNKSVGYSSYTFKDDEMKHYNDLMDAIMYQVLTTENQVNNGN